MTIFPTNINFCMSSRPKVKSPCIENISSSVNVMFTNFLQIRTKCTRLAFSEPHFRQGCFHSWASVLTGAGAGAGACVRAIQTGVVSALFEQMILRLQSFPKALVYWYKNLPGTSNSPAHQATSNMVLGKEYSCDISLARSEASALTALTRESGALDGAEVGSGGVQKTTKGTTYVTP